MYICSMQENVTVPFNMTHHLQWDSCCVVEWDNNAILYLVEWDNHSVVKEETSAIELKQNVFLSGMMLAQHPIQLLSLFLKWETFLLQSLLVGSFF